MARWLGRIEGVAPLLERYPDEDLRVVATAVSERLRGTSYYADDEDFAERVDELAEAGDVGYFDGALDGLYDWCDANRIWLDPNN